MAKPKRADSPPDADRGQQASPDSVEGPRTLAIDVGGSHVKASVLDHLYLGGGNARRITFEPDPDVTIIGNKAGIEGGVAAWHD